MSPLNLVSKTLIIIRRGSIFFYLTEISSLISLQVYFAGFLTQSNQLQVEIFMDSEINQLNQLLGQENSYNIASIVQTLNGGRLPFDQRNHQSLFSPANNQIRNRMFPFHTPSPFRAQDYYYEDENSRSPQSINYRNRGLNNNNISKVIQFEQSPKFNPISVAPATTARKPLFSEFSSPSYQKRNNRKNSKGLRNLSESVYKIVLEHKVTTYKEVAQELVRMLNDGQFGQIRETDDRNRDQQNIKRRVYDALNVLISADVLKKNGKYVISDDQMLSQKLKFPVKLPNTKDSPADLMEKIQKKKQEIKYKRQILNQIKNKRELLQAVIKRNRKEKAPQGQRVSFPAVSVVHQANNKQKPNFIFKYGKSAIRISQLGRISFIVGDLDLLMKIGLDIIKQNIDEIMDEDKSCENDFMIKHEIIKQQFKLQNLSNNQQKDNKKNQQAPKQKKKGQKKLLYSF